VAIIVIAFVLMVVLLGVMRKTQLGRALRAIAESPKAAHLLGINVEGLFLLFAPPPPWAVLPACWWGCPSTRSPSWASRCCTRASPSSSWAAWAISAAP
jgi:glycerol uptake facilitator-like aquaporin